MNDPLSSDTKRKYDPHYIEKKWQLYWEKNKTYKVEIDPTKPKYYILDMLPYPSGAGLHIGHPVGYTATDIVARYKRKLGYNVMHPMGWDSFGLPAEQYAIRTGVHPKITTEKNIDNIRSQLKQLGFSYDWDREIKTSDPKFYKWTQWIFTKLYEKELAYQADMMVNFCPALGTVLANEEVIDGKSAIGSHPVEKRALRQWVLKITAYADKLLEGLDGLDWPEGIKKLQRDWIGKSEGANVYFIEEKTQEVISVYTTTPETLFAATFLVIAPEHPLVKKIVSHDQKASVDNYVLEAANKPEIERSDATKAKTGVWSGAFCINPVTGHKIPIWVADYVLMGYGTGAIMAVPTHCDKDFEFAKKFDIKMTSVIKPDVTLNDLPLKEFQDKVLANEICYEGEGEIINSKTDLINLNGLSRAKAKEKVIRWLESVARGKKTTNYKLRDWLFARQRYWGEPIPILHFDDGTMRPLAPDELPLIAPDVPCYKPMNSGNSPLDQAKDWVNIFDEKSEKKAFRETNTMPQWAGSCWYFLRYLDPHNDVEFCSKEAQDYWMPVDLYIGGAEHAVLHLLYARFWYKVLFDLGLVTTSEPFQSLCNQGLVTARSYKTQSNHYVEPKDVTQEGNSYILTQTGEKLQSQVEKMSKSKLNGLSPDDVIEDNGTDALRLYEMFMAPIDKEKVWDNNGIQGCYRLLNRFYELVISNKVVDEEDEKAAKITHTLVKGVKEDIEKMFFNTAISKLMIFVNDFSKLNHYPKSMLLLATQCLYPFAPHLAYEAWEILGQKTELSYHPFPIHDEKYLVEDNATYIIQVNGKLRGKFDLPKDQSEDVITGLAKENENIAKHLSGTIVKTIFVPNKLVNFVIKP